MSILALALATADSHPSAEMTNPSTGLPVSPRRRVELRIESRPRVPMPEETKEWETLDGGGVVQDGQRNCKELVTNPATAKEELCLSI